MTTNEESRRSAGTEQKNASILSNALGSAVAGIISRLCTHPLDTAKARLQYPSVPYTGPIHVMASTFRTEGLVGLYRGLGAVLVGGTPGTVAYLCTYEVAKSQLAAHTPPFVTHFTAGMIAETMACIIYVPVDVVKERMQVQHATHTPSEHAYRHSWDALQKIVRHEGVSGIYRGYAATLASFGPFSALYFVFYEQFKEMARQGWPSLSSPSATDLSFSATVLCAATAGGLASWLTSPLDMAKLRLQVQRSQMATNESIVYTGMWDCLRQTWRTQGLRGWFRGAGARVLHFAPATTVTMTTYEFCRRRVEILLSGPSSV